MIANVRFVNDEKIAQELKQIAAEKQAKTSKVPRKSPDNHHLSRERTSDA
jgi:hypothetical protein